MYTITISLSTGFLSLYKNETLIKRYPIGVGKEKTPTPVGNFYITSKIPNPGGPFGAMWLGLNISHYGIHGTNNPSSIGKYVSKGCIRMYNRDVIELASIVEIGTRVIIRP